jgi:hypothetical protein
MHRVLDASQKPVGDGIGDRLRIFLSRPYFLLDLDAIRSTCSEAVDDVSLVVAAELLIGLRYVHGEIRTNDTLDGFLDALFQRVGREAADEDVG